MIALVDCNNFFVSCERLFNPKLLGKPVVVLSSNDGCVIARSNEAKALGIAMGVPAFQCTDIFKKHGVITLSSNFSLYADISSRVMQVLHTLCGDVEEYSIDEAFLKISRLVRHDQLEQFGHEIRQTVLRWVGIPVSVGIARTKTLAKAANSGAKKNPTYKSVCCFLNSQTEQHFLQQMPVRDVWGIGSAYEMLLHKNGIKSAYQLIGYPDDWIRKHMTIVGLKTVWELRGKPCLTIQDHIQPAQSIIRSRSFGIIVTKKSDLDEAIACHAARAGEKLRHAQQVAGYLSVFVIKRLFTGAPWRSEYRACALSFTSYSPHLIAAARSLMAPLFEDGYQYRKCGVILSNLISQHHQQNSLTDPPTDQNKAHTIISLVDRLNKRFGKNTVYFAAMGNGRTWQAQRKLKSPNFTTEWDEIPKAKIG